MAPISEQGQTGPHTLDEESPAESGFRWPKDRPADAERESELAAPERGWQRWTQLILIATGVAFAVWIYFAPLPDGLSAEGKTASAIFILCTVLWVTNAIPIGITGLLAVALLGSGGVMTPAAAFASFGNSAVFFILGVFILAAALIRSGLSKRCALLFLTKFERSPYRFATGMMLTAAIATAFMPAQATTAMLFPIAFEVARAMKLRPQSSAYGKVLFLSLAWGAMVGSNVSFLGSTRAALALGILSRSHQTTITFSQWIMASMPLVILGLLAVPIILRLLFPRERVDFDEAKRVLESAVAQLGPIRGDQIKVGVLMLTTVLAWILLGGRFDLAIIALLSATAMFVFGALRWEDLEGHIYWSVILMYGGAIALGAAIDQTGAAIWLVESLLDGARISPFVAIGGLAFGTLILSEFMSNAAAVAVMLPLGLGLGTQFGAPPVALTLAASFGAGLDFALPISSAPNTLAFASGYLRMTDFLRAGAVMTIVSILSLLLVAWLWWPAIGIF